MTIARRLLPLGLLLGAACHRPAAPAATDSAAVSAAHRGIPTLDPEVRLVASITVAMRDHAEFKDSILPAYRLTQAQFDSMKAEIMADSAKRAGYEHLVGSVTATPPAHQ